MKLWKTFSSLKQDDVEWNTECLGCEGIPTKSFLLELCSSIDDDCAYDVYFTDYFIEHHDDTYDFGDALDASLREGLDTKFTQLVKDYADSDMWLYGLYYNSLLVGYAVQRKLTEGEKKKTYRIQFNLDACVMTEVVAENAEQAIEVARKKFAEMSWDEYHNCMTDTGLTNRQFAVNANDSGDQCDNCDVFSI